MTAIAKCIGCGCDDDNACDNGLGEGCCWLFVDRSQQRGVCSCCVKALKRWHAGDRRVRGRWAVKFTRPGRRPEWLDDSTATLAMPNKTAKETFARRFAEHRTAAAIATRLNKLYMGWQAVETEVRT